MRAAKRNEHFVHMRKLEKIKNNPKTALYVICNPVIKNFTEKSFNYSYYHVS